jgi:hypothetical protein
MRLCLRVVSLICSLALIGAGAKAQVNDSGFQLQLFPGAGRLALYGPQNTCYALQSSSDLTNWTAAAVLNPTVWPAQVSLTVTHQATFFRSAVLSTWSIGGFGEALDLRKDFGAIGDGVADDTAAVQAMFNSTQVHSNLVVFVPPGSYRLTQTCTLGSSTEGIQPRLVLVGLDSAKTLFLWAGTGTGPVFQFVGCSPEFGALSIQTTNPAVTGVVYTASQ